MKLNNKKNKRLGVFVFFDKEGFVDDYVLYLLDSLKDATEDIIIVSNSYLSPSEKCKLNRYSDKIMFRHNIGLDAGAFKDVYDQYSEYFKNFDELLLINDTFFGPFESFKDICKKMENRDLDFWGLSTNYDSVDGYGFLPDKMIHSHIQTFFIAYRNNLLKSDVFNDYWKNYNMVNMNSFIDVVTKHEIAFTYYLEKNGFKWDVYCDLSKYHSKKIDENFNCYAYASYDMIKNLNAPFIKRKNFVFDKKDMLFLADSGDVKRSLEHIKNNKLYDTDLIWKNLIRVYDAKSLFYGMNLNFIISELKIDNDKKVATVIILENEKKQQMYIDFIKNTDIKDIYIFTENKNIKNNFKKNNIKICDKEDFLSDKYDYIGIIKDTDLNKQVIPTVYESNFNNMISNGYKSNTYLNNVAKVFEENKYIGLLLLPLSSHGDYFKENANEIPASYNSCFIKSEMFDWTIIMEDDFIKQYIEKLKKYKLLFGKIFNIEELPNILATNEYVIKNFYQLFNKKYNIINSSYPETINQIEQQQNAKLNISKYPRVKKIIKKVIKKK